MRKTLFPLFASLAVCAAAIGGVVATTAFAQPGDAAHKPVMVALTTTPAMAMNPAGPPMEGGPAHPPPGPGPDGRQPGGFCRDASARAVAAMAYVEARLQPTAAQEPLFARWKQVKLDEAKRRAADCGTAPRQARLRGAMPNPIEGMTREENQLKARLADISAEKPALEALYKSLTPTQQQALSPRRGGMMFAMREGRGMRGFGRPFPGDMPPPGAPGDMPPPQ